MKEATRYRVTGSLFLLAMAVIFLPMLFDGAGLPRVELAPVEPPPLAEFEIPDPAATEAGVPERGETLTWQDETQSGQGEVLAERVETLAGQVDEDGFQTDSDTRLGEPVLSDATLGGVRLGEAGPDTQAWAVQVASFADVENAKVFRSRLREDGYEAFLSTLRTGDEVRTRVAVGPLQSRAEAASLQTELSSRYRVTARLMAFSP